MEQWMKTMEKSMNTMEKSIETVNNRSKSWEIDERDGTVSENHGKIE